MKMLVRFLIFSALFLLISGVNTLVAQNTAGCTAQFGYQVAPGSMTVSFYPSFAQNTAQYSWDFGDGSLPASQAAPQHLYLQPGAYYVCLTVTAPTSTGSLCTAQWCDTVRIGSATGTCNPQFIWTAGNVVNGIQFSPALNGSAAQYAWNFGDGGTSGQLNPLHVYPGPGAYYACLTVTNGSCVNTYCDTVRVMNSTVTCDAHFSSTATVANSSTFYFQPVMNTVATRYQWNFGDGTTDTSRTPMHTYSQPGAYWACLTVVRYTSTGSTACTSTWCDSVRVVVNTATLCDAHFTHQLGSATNSVYFNPATNPVGAVYSWSFGDGGTSAMRTPSHVYSQPGTYLVCLNVNVIGANGGVTCTASWCDSILITQVSNPCSARFAWSVNNATQTASFRPQTIATNVAYSWNFGDGSTSSLLNPTHVYTTPGVYFVCLTVTRFSGSTANSCTDTWCDSVRINAPLPPNCNASFNFYRQFNTPLTFRFLPMTMAPGTSYLWNFGDGDTSTLRTPVHSYADTGVYQVCLTVVTINSAGSCTSTVCRNIVVRPLQPATAFCSAAFIFTRVSGTPGLFQFNTFASGGSLVYHWSFGDSTTSGQSNPLHQYTAPGAYNICLTVRDTIRNCSNRICRWLFLGSNLLPADPDEAEGGSLERISPETVEISAVVYPNPVSDHALLQVSGVSSTASCLIFDGTGRLVVALEGISDGSYELPIEQFTSGIYLYRITDGNQTALTGRFMVR